MEHTKLLSIVKDILNEGKTLWKAPKKYQTKHTLSDDQKDASKLQKYFTIKAVDNLHNKLILK